MKRTSHIRVQFGDGFVDAIVKTSFPELVRDKAGFLQDDIVSRIALQMRDVPYRGRAPLRAVTIK